MSILDDPRISGVLKKMLICSMLVILSAGSAHADWQYTHWGMSLLEVKEAAPVEITEMSLPSYAAVFGEIKLAGLEGKSGNRFVAFAFQNDRLSAVTIVSVNADGSLFISLQDRYGVPAALPGSEELGEVVWFWRHEPSNNNIRFAPETRGGAPAIIYTPILAAGAGGL